MKAGVQNKQWLPLMMSSQSVEFGRLEMRPQLVRREVQSSFTQSVNELWGRGGYERTGRKSTLNNLRLNYARAKTQGYAIFFIGPCWNNSGFGQMSETRRQQKQSNEAESQNRREIWAIGQCETNYETKRVHLWVEINQVEVTQVSESGCACVSHSLMTGTI